MTRVPVASHADTHRPPGTLSPSDPGGSDPIALPAGGGIQFGVDNVDSVPTPGLQIEATQYVPNDFSQPAAQISHAEATNFSLAVNATNGTMFTADPSNYANNANAIVTIEDHKTTGDLGAFGLQLFAQDTTPAGTKLVNGIYVDTRASNTSTHETDGIVSNAVGGAADVIAGKFIAQAGTGGREIALFAQTEGVLTGASSLPILALDNLNNPIFEVRNDGSVHIKTGTSIIADL